MSIDHAKAKSHMDEYFSRMKGMSANEKLTLRMRFMLQETIDLRRGSWDRKVLDPAMVAGAKKKDAAAAKGAGGKGLGGKGGGKGPQPAAGKGLGAGPSRSAAAEWEMAGGGGARGGQGAGAADGGGDREEAAGQPGRVSLVRRHEGAGHLHDGADHARRARQEGGAGQAAAL